MKRSRRKPSRPPSTPNYRINSRIRVREVRLIDETGTNRGVVPIEEARDLARDAELDLVEVAPNANPPVCRIMDYGKFSYEQTRKEREARKRQKKIEIKTVRLTPRTDDFHRDIGVKNARRWLNEGKKVKFMVRFRAREITYPEIGQKMLQGIAEDLNDIAEVEQKPNLEGWRMTMMLTPEGTV
ncbi:MAG: translation initiation factor IF-3 [Candidatus Promineifilaceae bacterium]